MILQNRHTDRLHNRQKMRWLKCIIDSVDVSLSKLQEIVKDRETWCAKVHVTKSWTWLNEQQQQTYIQFSSVTQSCPTLCDPHESQHARPPCPSPTPGVYPNPCLSSRWCHPAISSFVAPFSSCPQSLPASGSFQMSQLFTWDGQSTGVSASASVLPMNTQDWSPLERSYIERYIFRSIFRGIPLLPLSVHKTVTLFWTSFAFCSLSAFYVYMHAILLILAIYLN